MDVDLGIGFGYRLDYGVLLCLWLILYGVMFS